MLSSQPRFSTPPCHRAGVFCFMGRTPKSTQATEMPFSSRILRSEVGLVLVPASAEQPTPGRFYEIKRGDTLFGVAKRAYKTGSMEGARRINDSQFNLRFRKAVTGNEAKMFPNGRISFNPRFDGDLRVQMESTGAAPSGSSFAMIWIPKEDGREPF